MTFTVLVDNIGTVHVDKNLIGARTIAKEYREQIERGEGRAGPSITILDQWGEPIYEWCLAQDTTTGDCEISAAALF